MATTNLVLRTVYLSPKVDDRLRDEAFTLRTSKNDLIRKYIEAGMKALNAANAPAKKVAVAHVPPAVKHAVAAKRVAAAKKAAPKKAAAKKPAAKKALMSGHP
jgi:hypothetical protein